MSPEKRTNSNPDPERDSRTHAQSVQRWAGKLRDPSFTPTLDEFDALSLAAQHIQAETDDADVVTYTDIDGAELKAEAAEAVVSAADESHWQETPEDAAVSTKVLTCGSPRELKSSSPEAYRVYEQYCVRSGQSVSAASFDKFRDIKQARRSLLDGLAERRRETESGAEDPAHDKLIRSVAHLVTRVTAEDPASPDVNLSAEMDAEDASGATSTVTLSDYELGRVKELEPEIEAGLAIREMSEQEAKDKQWLDEHLNELMAISRISYMLNGKVQPAKNYTPKDKAAQQERATRFDTEFSLEQQLGLEPLPNGEAMPPLTVLSSEREVVDYRAPERRPRKTWPIAGAVYEAGVELGKDRGKTTRDIIGMTTGVITDPFVNPVKYGVDTLKGKHNRDKNQQRRADAIDAHEADLATRLADMQLETDTIASRMDRARELQAKLRDVYQRQKGYELKRQLSTKALNHVINGRDPSRELASEMRSARLSIGDLLPQFDTDRRKMRKADPDKKIRTPRPEAPKPTSAEKAADGSASTSSSRATEGKKSTSDENSAPKMGYAENPKYAELFSDETLERIRTDAAALAALSIQQELARQNAGKGDADKLTSLSPSTESLFVSAATRLVVRDRIGPDPDVADIALAIQEALEKRSEDKPL